MVAKRWSADDLDGHIMELLDQVATEGPQTIQDGSGRLYDILPRVSQEEDKTPVSGEANPLESYLLRRVAERAAMTAEEIREDDEFYDNFQRGLEEMRHDPEFNRERPNPFAWVEEMSDEEFEAWEQRLAKDRQYRAEIWPQVKPQ